MQADTIHRYVVRRHIHPGFSQELDDMIYLWLWTLYLYGKKAKEKPKERETTQLGFINF